MNPEPNLPGWQGKCQLAHCSGQQCPLLAHTMLRSWFHGILTSICTAWASLRCPDGMPNHSMIDPPSLELGIASLDLDLGYCPRSVSRAQHAPEGWTNLQEFGGFGYKPSHVRCASFRGCYMEINPSAQVLRTAALNQCAAHWKAGIPSTKYSQHR